MRGLFPFSREIYKDYNEDECLTLYSEVDNMRNMKNVIVGALAFTTGVTLVNKLKRKARRRKHGRKTTYVKR